MSAENRLTRDQLALMTTVLRHQDVRQVIADKAAETAPTLASDQDKLVQLLQLKLLTECSPVIGTILGILLLKTQNPDTIDLFETVHQTFDISEDVILQAARADLSAMYPTVFPRRSTTQQ